MEPHRPLRAFTLVELMIVVAIIGVLAAIAIPLVVHYQLKAKKAEVTVVMDGIWDAMQAYNAANDKWPTDMGITFQPSETTLGKTARAWNDGSIPAAFTEIGFSPDGAVRGSYSVGNVPLLVQVLGICDVDQDMGAGGDGAYYQWSWHPSSLAVNGRFEACTPSLLPISNCY